MQNSCGFSKEVITQVKKALSDDSAGNKPATMTDLDLAVKMLDELIALKFKRRPKHG